MNLLDLFNKELLEIVSELEHLQWSHWTRHFLEFDNPDNRKYWKELAHRPYFKLTEKQKESDREWARKVTQAIYDFGLQKEQYRELKLQQMLTIDFLVSESKRVQDAKGHRIAWGRRDPEADLNPLEALAMIHREAGEVQEEYRDDNQEGFGKELAGLILRCIHLAGDLKIPIGRHLLEEMKYNETRPYKHARKII